MNTLQHAHDKLTELKFSPYYQHKVKVLNGKLIYVPYAVVFYCPTKLLEKYLTVLERELPGYKLIHFESTQEMLMYPEDRKLQFVANQIYMSETVDQLINASRLVEFHYPENTELIGVLKKKFNECK